jgi:hypothetical protein
LEKLVLSALIKWKKVERVAIRKFKDNSFDHIEGVSKNSSNKVEGVSKNSFDRRVSPDFSDRLSERFTISLEGV